MAALSQAGVAIAFGTSVARHAAGRPGAPAGG
jgi:hypothetical protein